MLSPNNLLNKAELSLALKKSPSTIERWTREGKIKPLKIGRSVLFDLDEIIKQAKENNPSPQAA